MVDYSTEDKLGGQSCGLPDWVHGHYKPVIGHHMLEKWFIIFGILSQVSCGKVQKTLIFFFAQDYVKVAPGSLQLSRLPRPTEEKTENSPRYETQQSNQKKQNTFCEYSERFSMT